MAWLSVSRRTWSVAVPLGTLPAFGDITCAQDAVVVTISSIKPHRLVMPRALPLERRTLSQQPVATIAFCCAAFLSLSWFRLFSASLLFFHLSCGCVSAGCAIKVEENPIFVRRSCAPARSLFH